jgi:hypothetical protein
VVALSGFMGDASGSTPVVKPIWHRRADDGTSGQGFVASFGGG